MGDTDTSNNGDFSNNESLKFNQQSNCNEEKRNVEVIKNVTSLSNTVQPFEMKNQGKNFYNLPTFDSLGSHSNITESIPYSSNFLVLAPLTSSVSQNSQMSPSSFESHKISTVENVKLFDSQFSQSTSEPYVKNCVNQSDKKLLQPSNAAKNVLNNITLTNSTSFHSSLQSFDNSLKRISSEKFSSSNPLAEGAVESYLSFVKTHKKSTSEILTSFQASAGDTAEANSSYHTIPQENTSGTLGLLQSPRDDTVEADTSNCNIPKKRTSYGIHFLQSPEDFTAGAGTYNCNIPKKRTSYGIYFFPELEVEARSSYVKTQKKKRTSGMLGRFLEAPNYNKIKKPRFSEKLKFINFLGNDLTRSIISHDQLTGRHTTEKLNFYHSSADNSVEGFISKGYIDKIDISKRIKGKSFIPHKCSPKCIKWTKFCKEICLGKNPLVFPLLYGFQRRTKKIGDIRKIIYKTPCGVIIKNMNELHRYLLLTRSTMGVDLFEFDHRVKVLSEFCLEQHMCYIYLEDISRGIENIKIPCVNEIDGEWPSSIIYSKSRIPSSEIKINLDENFLICCTCDDDCMNKDKCECQNFTLENYKTFQNKNIDYNVGYRYKRLPRPVKSGIYECNNKCKCSSTCLNRVVQNPLQLKLQVFKTLKKGWGLRTVNDIPQGGFICVYTGKILTQDSANRNGIMYGGEYLAELDYIEAVEKFKEGYESGVIEENEQEENSATQEINLNVDEDDDKIKKEPPKFTASISTKEKNFKYQSVREMFGDQPDSCFVIDAKQTGNVGRYLNHSCKPNLFVQNVFVDTHDVRFPWLALFALDYIKAGTELTWDYNIYPGNIPCKPKKCYCESTHCRKRLY